MADAYSRMTRGEKMGVFAMQHGPGTENAYGGVAQAFSESVPVLVLPQGYARALAHVPDNYNACRSMRDITKTAEPILRAQDTPAILRRAFTALRNGRRRPALVEMPWDVLTEDVGETLDYAPVVSTRYGPDPTQVAAVARRLVDAPRLVIHAGQGVHWANAYSELRELAELLAAPVSTSLEGKSAFDETHPLALGSGGAAIPGQLRHFLDSADLIFGIGCSFAQTAFGVAMPGHVPIIHATLDPADINKGVPCEAALIGDAQLTLAMLIAEVRKLLPVPRDMTPVAEEIAKEEQAWLAQWLPLLESGDAPISPYRVLWELQRTVDVANTIITHDAGSPRDQLTPFWKSITRSAISAGANPPSLAMDWGWLWGPSWPVPTNCALTFGAMRRSVLPAWILKPPCASACRSFRSCSTIRPWPSSWTRCRWRRSAITPPPFPAIMPILPARWAAMAKGSPTRPKSPMQSGAGLPPRRQASPLCWNS
jgi:acetolactate synthase-1/2/3 large subunit